jgi:hypothetical protein
MMGKIRFANKSVLNSGEPCLVIARLVDGLAMPATKTKMRRWQTKPLPPPKKKLFLFSFFKKSKKPH